MKANTPRRLAPTVLAWIALAGWSSFLRAEDTETGLPPAAPDGPWPGAAVERLMGVAPGEHVRVALRPSSPRTGFFLAQPFDPALAVPTDAIQIYAGLESTAPSVGLGAASGNGANITSWRGHGYFTQLFLHSRYGADVRKVDAETQADQFGRPLGVISVTHDGKQVDLAVGPISTDLVAFMTRSHGPGLSLQFIDRYMIPTQGRIDLAPRYYRESVAAGVSGFCFDEPEIWANAGYSQAFKDEWLAHYGTPWQPPAGSVDARYKAEQLKTALLRRGVEAILNDAKHQRPALTALLAVHSPANYAEMGMIAPHHRLSTIPALDEIVAEVWNEPFEAGYLQYSSFWNLTRGTGKRLWFMMDPWGDSPAMSLDFYRRSYGNNLVAALMFPQIERYQPLIWPNRLYGHIPKDYETLINTVTGAVAELWRYPGKVESGSGAVGTFVSDSMSWQRATPTPSDFDGLHGLSQPLVQQGVPVDMLSLDRAAEPGYLAGVKCLLLSYDFLKPTDAAQNRALAEWTRQGGTLICFGGTDAYNAVTDSWWAHVGHATPLEALFAELGQPLTKPRVLAEPGQKAELDPIGAIPGLGPITVPLGPTPAEEQYRRRISGLQTEEHPTEFAHTYPVTLYGPPAGAVPLYQLRDSHQVVAWEAAVGRGSVIFVGVSPGFLKSSAAGPAWARAWARHGLERAGSPYREQPYFLLRRGPYTALRTLDQPHRLTGRYVDLLSPTLAVLENPLFAEQECAFLSEADERDGPPRLLAASGRVRATCESATVTSCLVQAPSNTDGAARFWAGSRQVLHANAFNSTGTSLATTFRVEGDTLLVQYPNDAAGAVVRVDWKP